MVDRAGIEPDPIECVKEKIFNVLWQMKKDGYAESTIKATGRRLRMIAKSVPLSDPEAVKEYIAEKLSLIHI